MWNPLFFLSADVKASRFYFLRCLSFSLPIQLVSKPLFYISSGVKALIFHFRWCQSFYFFIFVGVKASLFYFRWCGTLSFSFLLMSKPLVSISSGVKAFLFYFLRCQSFYFLFPLVSKSLTPEEIEKRGFDISGNDKQRVLHQRKQKIEALTQAEMKRKALTPEEIEKRGFDISGNEKEKVPHRISPDSPGAHRNARARFGAVWRQLRKWSTSGCVFLGF